VGHIAATASCEAETVLGEEWTEAAISGMGARASGRQRALVAALGGRLLAEEADGARSMGLLCAGLNSHGYFILSVWGPVSVAPPAPY
jgi:hypothetical protein